MIDLLLAVRNLMRNRRRSFATFFALALGCASILLFGGFRKSIEYSLETSYVRDGGHLQIQHRDLFLYGSGNPIKYSIAEYDQLVQALRADPALSKLVRVATPTLQFGGIASNFSANVSRTVVGMGIVAADHNTMREWNGFGLPIPPNRSALDGAPSDATVVGTGVARVLLLCEALKIEDCPVPPKEEVADGPALPADIAALAKRDAPKAAPAARGGAPRIELLSSSAGGAPNVVSLQVVRAQRQGFKELDEIFVVLNLQQAQRLIFGRSSPKATAIVVQLGNSDDIDDAKQHIQRVIATQPNPQPLAVLDFRELNAFYVQTVQMFDMIFGFIFVLIAAIVLFTVGNTMSTAVMERTVEIGTIRTLGLRQRGVQRLFVLEGTLLGIAGALSGTLFAIVASIAINHSGLTWLPPGSGSRLPLLFLVWGETWTIIGVTLGLIVIAALSAWLPALRASRLVIVDALRHA
jgi:putative ABC transport system permease protein